MQKPKCQRVTKKGREKFVPISFFVFFVFWAIKKDDSYYFLKLVGLTTSTFSYFYGGEYFGVML